MPLHYRNRAEIDSIDRSGYHPMGTLLIVCLILLTLFSAGCVRRRMTVNTNVPGVTVYLDDKEIGRTPFSTNFDHYGKREFRLVKEGYETRTVLLPVRAPWYQWIGLDFVSEVLLPGKLTDHKYYTFEMQPDTLVPTHELVTRASDLRRMAHAEGTIRVNDGGTTLTPTGPEGGSIVSGSQPVQSIPYQQPLQAPAPTLYQDQPSLAPPANSPEQYTPPRF